MSDYKPSAFNDLSGSSDETPTRVESGPPFSAAGAAPDGTVSAQSLAPGGVSSVAPPPASMSGSSRWRWAVVGVVTVLVVGLLGAAFVLAQPQSGAPSTVARYAPADTAILVELRQDLPGDQHNLLAQFMSHFPGFADQAAFDQKLDETLDSMFARSDGDVSWADDIKPWFDGQVGVFSSTLTPGPGTPPSMTVALTVKAGQKAALEGWLIPLLGSDWQETTYENQAIWSGQLPDSAERVSLTWSDEALLIGTRIEDLQAALDARADRSDGLADDAYFLGQLSALHADRLGTFYFDGRAMAQTLRDQLAGIDSVAGMDDLIVDLVAVRMFGEVRAEGDHLAFTTRTERAAGSNMPPLSANRSTTLAEAAPRDAMFYAEVRDVGQTIGFYINDLLLPLLSAQGAPFDASALQQLLGVPPQDFFDFIVDASVSLSGSATAPEVGLIATVDDNAIATARVNTITTLLRAAMQFGGGVTFAEEQHGAATLTVITMTGGLGEGLPASVAISVTGDRLLIGTRDFVIGVLDRQRDQSLATRPEYQAALAAGGTANAGVVFVDIAAAISAAEEMVPADERADYDLNQRPFLAPMSHLAIVSTTDAGAQVNHVFLYVK